VAEDRFRLSASFANSSEREMGQDKLFFLSTTRSAGGGYTRRGTYTRNVVLNLDGRKLGQRYSGKPIQYFTRSMIGMDQNFDETEDRVFADTPFIKNARSYIESAHILVTGSVLEPRDRKQIMQFKLHKVPVFLYQDAQAFLLQDTRNAVPLSAYQMEPQVGEPSYSRYDSRASKKQEFRRSGSDKLQYGVQRWIELMTRPVEHYQTMHYSKKELINGIALGYSQDAIRSLDADLHNAKNDPSWTSRLAPLFKKHNLRSPKDVIAFIANRWRSVV
jgi:hypothetical protein